MDVRVGGHVVINKGGLVFGEHPMCPRINSTHCAIYPLC